MLRRRLPGCYRKAGAKPLRVGEEGQAGRGFRTRRRELMDAPPYARADGLAAPALTRTRRRSPLRSEAKWGLVYVLPALAAVIAFVAYPFFSIVVHAFTRWNGYSDPMFIRLRNVEFILRDGT